VVLYFDDKPPRAQLLEITPEYNGRPEPLRDWIQDGQAAALVLFTGFGKEHTKDEPPMQQRTNLGSRISKTTTIPHALLIFPISVTP